MNKTKQTNKWCVCKVKEGLGPSVVYEFDEHKKSFTGIGDVISPSKKIKRQVHGDNVNFLIPVFEDYVFVSYTNISAVLNFVDSISAVWFVLKNATTGKIENVDSEDVYKFSDMKPPVDDLAVGDCVRAIKGDFKQLEGYVLNIIGDYVEVRFELFTIVRVALLSKYDLTKI